MRSLQSEGDSLLVRFESECCDGAFQDLSNGCGSLLAGKSFECFQLGLGPIAPFRFLTLCHAVPRFVGAL